MNISIPHITQHNIIHDTMDHSVTLYKTPLVTLTLVTLVTLTRYNSILGPRKIITSRAKFPIATAKAHRIAVVGSSNEEHQTFNDFWSLEAEILF